MTTKVAIVETSVCGVKAYHAKCLTCGVRVCPQAHDKEATAVKHAGEHVCEETP